MWEIQNLLESNDLSDSDRLTLRETFDELANPELDEQGRISRWKRIKKLVPGGLETGSRALKILDTVLSVAEKTQLGL